MATSRPLSLRVTKTSTARVSLKRSQRTGPASRRASPTSGAHAVDLERDSATLEIHPIIKFRAQKKFRARTLEGLRFVFFKNILFPIERSTNTSSGDLVNVHFQPIFFSHSKRPPRSVRFFFFFFFFFCRCSGGGSYALPVASVDHQSLPLSSSFLLNRYYILFSILFTRYLSVKAFSLALLFFLSSRLDPPPVAPIHAPNSRVFTDITPKLKLYTSTI
jgi:hypothetical protein